MGQGGILMHLRSPLRHLHNLLPPILRSLILLNRYGSYGKSGADQITADFTNENPMSFAERLHEIDVEINYEPVNHGDPFTAGENHIEPLTLLGTTRIIWAN
jgi:hypothetical protein